MHFQSFTQFFRALFEMQIVGLLKLTLATAKVLLQPSTDHLWRIWI